MAARKKAPKSPQPFKPSFERKEIGTMGMADDMRRLAEEMMSAFDARLARVAILRQETVEKLNGFRQAMKNVQHELRRKAADLKRFLGNTETSRMREFRTMHQGIRAHHENIRARQEERNTEVAGMRDRFHREQEAMHREMGAMAGHWRTLAFTKARRPRVAR